jgi:hypothetical protein
MVHDYNYRPKFVDIRVRKPPQVSINVDGPPCQHPGCKKEATHRAPKSRDKPEELWMFCKEHAAIYNANWDFFEGMTEEEFQRFQASAAHGHRTTWNFRTGAAGSREGRTYRTAAEGAPWQDPYGAFRGRRGGTGKATPDSSGVSTVPAPVRQALRDMGLEEDADRAAVRIAYRDLVRRFHPDSNGGDRSAEGRLQIVVKAYKVLKMARRA